MKSLEIINKDLQDFEKTLENYKKRKTINNEEVDEEYIKQMTKEIENYKQIKQDLERLQKQDEGIKSGELSDGYHTFNDLYYQRVILFATLVNQNKKTSWKSYKHEDGELCFGGGWFIVGIDTPQGSYTYHYENKYWDLFQCKELEKGKHWDGHTSKDVDRLLSIKNEDLEVLEIIRKKRVNVIELKIFQFCNWDDNTFLYLYNLNRCDEYKLTLEELLKLKQWLKENEDDNKSL